MRRRITACATAAVALQLAGCGVVGGHAVATQDEAIAAAKTTLVGTPQADGPFEVTRDGDIWMVTVKAGAAGSASVSVNAKTGKTEKLYSDAAPASPTKAPKPAPR